MNVEEGEISENLLDDKDKDISTLVSASSDFKRQISQGEYGRPRQFPVREFASRGECYY